MTTELIIAALVVLGIPAAIVLWQLIIVVPMWVQAKSSGVDVTPINLIGAKLRRLDANRLAQSLIVGRQGGLDVGFARLEQHAMAGGNVYSLVEAAVSAQKAQLDVSFEDLARIDLAGRDIVYAVDASVNPKVIVAEDIAGVSRDGIRIGARVRVTVRTNLHKLVGGANTQTIMARVGEGTVAAIGQAPSHKEVLQNPDLISRYILEHGLDTGTAYQIVSVDVADVDVRDNIGARLQEETADADTLIAQARAEMRRAAAVATEREMVARVKGMTVRETEAKAEIPEAMAKSVRGGTIGIKKTPMLGPFRRCLWQG